MSPRPLFEFLFRHPVLAFIVMGASFLLFGIASVDLYVLLAANIRLFLEHGWVVVEDGALAQLAQLLGLALLSIAFYLLFAVCDRVLVRRLTERGLRERSVEPDR